MLRFQSQLQVSAMPDELLDSSFEVIMPTLDIADFDNNVIDVGETSLLSRAKAALNKMNFINGYTPVVEQVTFTPLNFKSEARRVRSQWINFATDINTYGEVGITMFCSANMLTQYYLEAWRSLVFDPNGEYFNSAAVYKKNIEVYIYGPGNVGIGELTTAHFTLEGCFPTTQDAFKFNYSTNPKRVTITQRFKVDKISYDSTKAYSSIITELVSSPTSVIDKTITNLMGGNTTYDIQDTYK